MNSTTTESEDDDYQEEDSFSDLSASTGDDMHDIDYGEEDEEYSQSNKLKGINAKQTIQIGYDKVKDEELEEYMNEYNEIDVKLIVGRDCIHLHLNELMEAQEVIDIVGDMFGLIDNRLGLEMNGKLVKPAAKLNSLAVNKSIEMKVVFCIDDDVTSVIIDNDEHPEYVEENFKECQNISVQTNSRKQLCSRETQTPNFPLMDSATNTPHTKSVQSDPVVGPKDKIIQAKEYVPHDDLVKYQNQQAIMIQKSIRRFLAQKRIVKMKKERDIALLKKKLQIEEMSYSKLQDRIQEIMNKRPILLRDDFAKANSLLVDWLNKEKLKIKQDNSGKNLKIALSQLFKKEMDCLHYIQKCRMMKKNEIDQKFKLHLLEEASQPISKQHSKRNNITENENTLKASIFKNFYNELRSRDINEDERIAFLNNLKEFLESMKAPECTQEMILLIDREIQMILLGIKKSSLEGSRKRLEELFLYLSTDPEFNPASSKFQRQSDESTLFACRTCKELKPPEKFNIDLLKGLNHCTACTLRKELAHSNIILSPYKEMIQQIYADEIKRGSHEGYVNLLQATGLHYLVQRIWQGRSCLSEENDIELLRFIRWNKNYPWAPWNCILLTENESELHQAVENIDSFYGEHFIKKIENKHLQAKIKFSDLEELNGRIKTSHYHIHDSRFKFSKDHRLVNLVVNPKTTKLQPNCILTEPISDLVFARCNYN